LGSNVSNLDVAHVGLRCESVLMKFARLSLIALPLAALLPIAPSLTACSASNEEDDTDSEESFATAAEITQARQVVALLSGPSGKCNTCHGASPQAIARWGTSMQAAHAKCLATTVNKTPAERVACLRGTGAGFDASRLGLLTAGAHTAEFKTLFQSAFGASGISEHAAFVTQAGMPRGGGTKLTATQWNNVKGWVLRGMPGLAEATGQTPDGGAPDAGGSCVERIDPALTAHVRTMARDGWAARLRDQSTVMMGCGAATSAGACLTSFPNVTARHAAPASAQIIRELRELPLASHYWVRSSVDGRFFGFGLNDNRGARILDLAKPATAAPIVVDAKYDPSFFPNNEGFSFAGSLGDNSLRACRMSLLTDAARAAAPHITLTEDKCTRIGGSVYQSVGAAIDGSRYFVTAGIHENDDGGHQAHGPLAAAYSTSASTQFTPMVNDGVTFRAGAPIALPLPNEGDVIQSPSSRAFTTRLSDGNKQTGLRIHLLNASGTGANLSLAAPIVATFCGNGAKGEWSLDERFITFHDYVAPGQGLPENSSNVVIIDLLTGKRTRVTESKTGVYALYPHFRADGWLMFLVRDTNTGKETLLASDIALR
jgi:hypothetical protein